MLVQIIASVLFILLFIVSVSEIIRAYRIQKKRRLKPYQRESLSFVQQFGRAQRGTSAAVVYDGEPFNRSGTVTGRWSGKTPNVKEIERNGNEEKQELDPNAWDHPETYGPS